MPGKIGLTASYGDSSRVYELAFQQASYSFDVLIDGLGNITDRRIHLTTRSFSGGGTFNWQYGISYNSLQINLGNSYTDVVGDRYDVVRLDTLGLMWGFGNRWSWDNGFAVGADWFKVFWPMTTLVKEAGFIDETSDEDDADDVETLVDGISKFPTFTLAHFEIGYRF